MSVDEKNFYFAAQKKEEPCTFFLMRVIKTQAVKVFEGGVGENFFQKVSPINTFPMVLCGYNSNNRPTATSQAGDRVCGAFEAS